MPNQSVSATASPNGRNNPGFVHLSPRMETGAAGNSSSPVSRSNELEQWWKALSHRQPTTTYFDADRVKPNASGILCPDNAATIKINNTSAAADDGKPIHASKFAITRHNAASSTSIAAHSTNTYAIGQSPHSETFEDFLVAGLESKLGLYQFVSESTHNGKKSRTTTPIVNFLEERIKEQNEKGLPPLKLGDRFSVKTFKPASQDSALSGCKQYFLTVIDSANNNNEITVPITQAGLPFRDAVLSSEAISRASAMMDQHLTVLQQPSDGSTNDPLVLSHAGYGRNATLMTYRNICLRITEGTITNNEQIDQQVRQFIEERRLVRPGFVHSLPQVEQLEKALQDKLTAHQNASGPFATSAGIRHARSTSPPRIVLTNPAPVPKAPVERLSTSRADIADMAVDGIVVDRTIVTEKEDFKNLVIATLTRSQLGNNAGFKPIGGTEPAQIARQRAATQTQPHHVLAVSFQLKNQNNSYAWSPEKVMREFRGILNSAATAGLKSVGIAASLLDSSSASSTSESLISHGHVIALAIAAVDQHASESGKPINVTFQCATPEQQVIVDDVIARREQLKDHRYHQALLRPPIRTPTMVSNDPLADFADPTKRASFVPVAVTAALDGTLAFHHETPLPATLPASNLPFAPWHNVPTSRAEWEEGDIYLSGDENSKNIDAAGVVIVEDDGRVLVVAPTNGFAGLDYTFPKGGRDGNKSRNEQWSVQATARKEAYEESGLQVQLTGVLCDYRAKQTTRYYLAKRIGGTPADVGWESQGVHFVPQDQLRSMMVLRNNWRENIVLDVLGVARDADVAFAQLDALLRRPDCKLESDEFDAVAKQTSIAMKFIGMHRPHDELVPESQVLARIHSRQPLKATALKIPGAKSDGPAYLHANTVDLNVSREYIAAQYPFSNNRVDPPVENRDDFWRTLAANEVNLIVDLTVPNENKNDAAYAPTSTAPLKIDTYELHSIAASQRKNLRLAIDDATIRLVPRQLNEPEREIKRLHFTEWADKTAIAVDALIELAEQIKQSSRPGDKVLIHCSHGVGRTGTLITFLAASEIIAAEIARGVEFTVTDFLHIVRDVLIKGRESRGEQFVGETQFSLVIQALLQKHFVDGIVDGKLSAKPALQEAA